jgi:hypothetical protein
VTIASVIDCRHYGFFWLLIKLISDFDAKSEPSSPALRSNDRICPKVAVGGFVEGGAPSLRRARHHPRHGRIGAITAESSSVVSRGGRQAIGRCLSL